MSTPAGDTTSRNEPNTPATSTTPAPARPPRGFVLWLSVGQLISWGTLFYAFSLLLEHFERDLQLSRVDASLAFSVALLVEGLLAFLVGQWIDAGRARAVMCGGSALAGLGFLLMGVVHEAWQLYAVWALIGAAMAGVLYQPAFSVLIRRYPEDYRRAIITLTFLGGLASTVFIPLQAFLIQHVGWRQAVMLLSLLHFLVVLPIHVWWLRGEPPAQAHQSGEPRKRLVEYTHHFPFWGLAAFFVLFSGIATAMGGHLVTILREQRLPEAWVIAIPASIGVLQVAGRLLLYFTEKHLDVHFANRWIPPLLPAALFVLLLQSLLGLPPVVALLYALLYGMANGMITIVKATAMATYVSRERAASLNGLLGAPTAVARAIAPSLLAALWTASGNYSLGLALLCLVGIVATGAFWMAQSRSELRKA
ncbi:MAG: MFS transporter [Burkholderiales bacterium]|nr:MFS transporter [Burkholderiales bacterium]